MKTPSPKDSALDLLDSCYQTAVNGIGKVMPPIETMAENYLSKSFYSQTAAKNMIKNQITKCTTSGFITGLGGLITLPIAVPANLASVLVVQLRMIAALAYMSGYNIHDDQTQTFIYACLAGVSVNSVLKQFGIKFGKKVAEQGVKKIPFEIIKSINKTLGFRFITLWGEKGLINLGKMIPIVGGVINGGFDFAETKIIASRAYKTFILGNFNIGESIAIEPESIETENINI